MSDDNRGQKLMLLARMGTLAHHMCIQYPEVADKIKARTITRQPSNKAEEEETEKFVRSLYRGK